MTPRPIVIDTDPGVDDALAIFLALGSPELALLGITTVAGNLPLSSTEANARRLCELAGRRDVKVFAGCPRPILRPLVTAEQFHGPEGLGDLVLPEPGMPLQDRHAVDWLVETLMAAEDGAVTLCALGPLTNLALAMVEQPAILPKIREIVMMGGSVFHGGNVTPAAEFNIHVDPHAAAVVFGCGRPLTLMPLDVAHKALATAERFARLEALDTAVGRACREMLTFYRRSHAARHGSADVPLYDPCVTAYLLRPEIFGGRAVQVQVETASEATLGMTVVDWRGKTGAAPNCTVMTEIDADAFFELLIERIGRL